MDHKSKYDQVFIENFSVERDELTDDLEYNSITAWDSIGHMSMIAGLEETFDIIMEMDDIIDFSSYKVGKEIIKKYGVLL